MVIFKIHIQTVKSFSDLQYSDTVGNGGTYLDWIIGKGSWMQMFTTVRD